MPNLFRRLRHNTSATNSLSKYEQKKIEANQILERIRMKYPNAYLDRETVQQDVKTLTAVMKKYRKKSINVQRSGCSAIANIARNKKNRTIITDYNVQKILLRALKEYRCDWIVCHFSLVAIGCLASVDSCRIKFDCSFCKMIIEVLEAYMDENEIVMNALGALANLMKCKKLRKKCEKLHVLKLFMRVIQQNNDVCIFRAGAALFSNLAHSEKIATFLIEIGIVELLVDMMREHESDPLVQRWCCLALSNISFSAGYNNKLLECHGIEQLRAALNIDLVNPSIHIEVFADKALFSEGEDWMEAHLGTIHEAARKGLYRNCFKWLSNGVDVNIEDSNGNTPLYYCISNNKCLLIQLFVSLGANVHLKNKNDVSSWDAIHNKDSNAKEIILLFVELGKKLLKGAKISMNKMLFVECSRNVRDFPPEISLLIIEFVNPVTIMKHYRRQVDQFSAPFKISITCDCDT